MNDPFRRAPALLGAASRRWLLVAALALLAACKVGPDYTRPDAPMPAQYKEIDGWVLAAPQQAESADWWSIYQDSALDGLEKQVDISNQTLKASEAAYREAQAVVRQARAALFPTIGVNASVKRSGGGSGGFSTTTGNGVVRAGGRTVTNYDANATLSWDADIWGRIRRTIESDVANAQATAADLAAARLSAQSTLATDYFDLRIADEQKNLLEDTVKAFMQTLEITRNQFRAGTVAQTDVITAETQLEGAEAQLISVGVTRAQLEHAIAVLAGKPPGDFSVEPAPLSNAVPVIPPGVPSTLLQRRPDIAAAERSMAAANAQIGVAVAAWYPDITLSASTGFSSTELGKLFDVANNVWSFGPQLAYTVFDFGARSAQIAQARAAFDQSVANYRQTVLTAFQGVEDQLAALRILAQQAEVEDRAVASAREALRLTLNQYQAGTVAYTAVVTAQATLLADQQTALTILQNRLAASVALIEALGGGWGATQLPAEP